MVYHIRTHIVSSGLSVKLESHRLCPKHGVLVWWCVCGRGSNRRHARPMTHKGEVTNFDDLATGLHSNVEYNWGEYLKQFI